MTYGISIHVIVMDNQCGQSQFSISPLMLGTVLKFFTYALVLFGSKVKRWRHRPYLFCITISDASVALLFAKKSFPSTRLFGLTKEQSCSSPDAQTLFSYL